ncbi:hypothetical protein [Bradyrhizobium sp. ORS 375]|uniref:hypothetical protein n=1 Tax=Bradyrhizobium sp. (strain ORS 375) TaxID=566679 RepID=UPI001FCAC33D|nr:hypothetical protein [Bradyrhizobium sp. ORS 375]
MPSAVAPGSLPRAIAMAASVPATSDSAVDSTAICSDSDSDGQKPSSRPIRPYQRSEAPDSGRSNTGVGEKLAAAITTSGSSRNSASAIASTQQTTMAARLIMSAPATASR